MENLEYQVEASKTIPEWETYKNLELTPKDKMALNAFLGLSGEVGELVDMFKKYYFQGHKLNREDAEKEMGDIFWYLNLLCQAMGISFSEIMEKNIQKLRKRYGEHFDSNKSINREEYQK